MTKIKQIKATEIFNSRGYPTLEVQVILEDGSMATAQVPSGASKGKKEALEIIDKDSTRLAGMGVLTAVENVNGKIAKSLVGKDVTLQNEIDQELIDLDGKKNKSFLGANAILGTSLAICKAHAVSKGVDLYRVFDKLITQKQDRFNYCAPIPMLNVINGGMHADNKISLQEFMLVPVGFKKFRDAIISAAEVLYRLKSILKKEGHSTNVGDEGGFAPSLQNTVQVLDLLKSAIGTDCDKIKIALDCAASTFFVGDKYCIDQKQLSTKQLIDFYSNLVEQYGIVSLEDPLAEDDVDGWTQITKNLGNKIKIVGDDLFVTNPQIIKNGIEAHLANAVLVKMNQIGTITETIEAINTAKQGGYSVVISHRSAETEDVSIAHLAVACGANTMIKAGCLARSERVAKYNELLRIEDKAFY